MYASLTVTFDGREHGARGARLDDDIDRGGAAAHEVPRLGADFDQAGVLEAQVRFEHGRDAAAALLGEAPHRRQPIAGAQRTAIDRMAELGGE